MSRPKINGQRNERNDKNVFYFFPPRTFLKPILANPHLAHLVFADTQANASKNQKSQIFSTTQIIGVIYFTIFANICQDNNFIMAKQFGERIRELRTKQNLLLRQLASKLDVDTSIISKVERGERQLKKEQIPLLADILKADKTELETLWLADQVMDLIKDEPLADEALKSVTKTIKKTK